MSDERDSAIVTITDPAATPPEKIVAFDKARKKLLDVDLDRPFFAIKRYVDPGKCDHRHRGVTLDMATRKVYCRCGDEIDAFDALLIYAHAETHLQNTRHYLEEHARKEQEKKDKEPHVKQVTAAQRVTGRRGRFLGWQLRLDCGHQMQWDRKRLPKTATCDSCYRAAVLQARGVGVVKS
jgi:hypothetical protein